MGGFRDLSALEIKAVSGGFDDGSGGFSNPQTEYFRQTGIWVENPMVATSLLSDSQGIGFGDGGSGGGEGSGYVSGTDYCGSGWSSALVPDSIMGIDISLACFIHDVAYSAGSDQDRADADMDFFNNILILLVAGGMSPVGAAAIAGGYYTGVRAAGGEHYDGTGSSF